MKNKFIQIAIDGPAGSGKTTVAQALASALAIDYLSSGRIFRAYAHLLKNSDYENEKAVKKELKNNKVWYENEHFYINGVDVTSDITSDNLSNIASKVSAYGFVRKMYKKLIHKIIKGTNVVIDGRDIGTVIIPKATFKYYLIATPEIRAKRRAKQNKVALTSAKFKKILDEINKRDHADSTRKNSPLKKAKDAKLIDSSDMTVQQVVDLIAQDVKKFRGEQ